MVTIVKCNFLGCYYNNGGECAKTIVGLDEMGHCMQIWKNGQMRQPTIPWNASPDERQSWKPPYTDVDQKDLRRIKDSGEE